MQATQGSMGHDDICRLPWSIFCSYVKDVANTQQEAQDRRDFNESDKLTKIWEENKERWAVM